MRYMALACDYDGTRAQSGRLTERTIEALNRLRLSGRRTILVTGRILEDLLRVCPDLSIFDAVVLENGAVVYWPATRESTQLCLTPPRSLAEALENRGVEPLVQGRVLLATWRPHEVTVLETIRDQGLELQIIFNENAVMVLPAGINKGSGLDSVLRRLGLSRHEVAGVGNAQNDHSFLDLCECSVAVANAIASIRAKVDFTTAAANGEGVVELIEELIATDFAHRTTSGPGDTVELAALEDGSTLSFQPYGQNILVSGPSGAGKSTFATGLIERLTARSYQL